MTRRADSTAAPVADHRLIGFRSHLRTEVVPGDAAYLVSDQGVTALQGEGIERLVPLLDGTRDLAGVLRDAAPGLPDGRARQLIARLARAGLIGYHGESAAEPARRSARAYWELAGLDGAVALGRVEAGAAVLAVGGADAGEVEQACRNNGLSVTAAAGAGELSVVVCADYLDPALREIDAAHRAAGRAWLAVKPGGSSPWVGPVFGAADGPCWTCLAHRLRAHRRSEVPVQRALGLAGPVARPDTSVPAVRALGAQLAALEAAKWLAGYRHPGQREIRVLDSLGLAVQGHRVSRRPQCPECGDPGLMAAQLARPVVPVARPKADGADCHRAETPEQVYERYGPLVSPVTGVIAEIRRDPRAPVRINCYLSGRNPVAGSADLAQLRAGLRQMSGGKGATPLEAKVSALCEALERHCGALHGDETRIRGSYRELAAEAVHPDDCQLFDPRQYTDRERWNERHSVFQYVPAPFDETEPVDWTPVWSLADGRRRLLPTGMLYYSCAVGPVTPPAGSRALRADSNGNAAGSSLEDAIVHGFLELVERDAVALWWYNRTRQPAVRMEEFGDIWDRDAMELYAGLNREVWALDLTSDLGIPVFAVLSRRTDKPAEDVMFGFGAHFDARIALRRALTEMGQLLPAALGAAPDGTGYDLDDPELLSWWRAATVRNQPYLLPDPGRAARGPADFPAGPRRDLGEEVAACVETVRAHGLDLLVLDQTRPDIGLPVVKVVVPGLRQFWARFAPGRLFDVPVALGRLARPSRYEELNPIPLFV
ncbi:TOMM precursor leader peptide-binding protein [Kitasatospora sp. NPDC048296]|uniref:TOMM precursor leader peptide-binding protein n=1 Tax=Kitasatospora sp. NPDC048296 TaxID=3364048 RepID=UPI00371ED157